MEINWKPNHQFFKNPDSGEMEAIVSYRANVGKYVYTVTELDSDYSLTCTDPEWLSALPLMKFENESKAFKFVEFIESLVPFRNCANVTASELSQFPFFKELFAHIAFNERVLFVGTDTLAHVWLTAGSD